MKYSTRNDSWQRSENVVRFDKEVYLMKDFLQIIFWLFEWILTTTQSGL